MLRLNERDWFTPISVFACGSLLPKLRRFSPILCYQGLFCWRSRRLYGGFMPTPLPKLFVRPRRTFLVATSGVLTVLVIAGAIVLYQRSQPVVEKINYSQLYNVAQTGAGAA